MFTLIMTELLAGNSSGAVLKVVEVKEREAEEAEQGVEEGVEEATPPDDSPASLLTPGGQEASAFCLQASSVMIKINQTSLSKPANQSFVAGSTRK